MKHPDDPKGLFLGEPQWGRDSTWSTGAHNENASDHAVSQPIMVNSRRSGSYPGSEGPAMLSPRSNDTGGLGVKMVEYVLGSSPTAKDLDGRMHSRLQALEKHKKQMKSSYGDHESKLHHKDSAGAMSAIQSNGIMQNGLDDENKMFNRTPGCHQLEDDSDLAKTHGLVNDMSKMKPNDALMQAGIPSMLAGGHGPHPFADAFAEQVGIDPLQFGGDYASHLMHSIESPGILDYNNTIYQRPNQPTGQLPAALIASHQQQFSLAQQQSQGMGPHTTPTMGGPTGSGNNPFTPQNPYYGTDPFSASMAGHIIPAGPPPAMMAQYYGLPPWGMYPSMIQSGQVGGQSTPHLQQQQQMLARSNGTRPMTPQGPNDNPGTPQALQGQYQMVPHGYYDQNGSIMMGNTGRGMNPTPMRMMPMIVNQSGNNNIRMMPNAGQSTQHSGPPNAMFSQNGSNGPNNGMNKLATD